MASIPLFARFSLFACLSLPRTTQSALQIRFVGVGKYAGVEGPCAFCSKAEEELRFSEVLPVPVEDGFLDLLDSPTKPQVALLVTRDGGLWDNLPLNRVETPLAKRDTLYSLERLVTTGKSLFQSFNIAMTDVAGVSILGAQLEDASRVSEPDKVLVGGALLLSDPSGAAKLVETFAEEAIAAATELQVPLTVDAELFAAASAKIRSFEVTSRGRLRIDTEAPEVPERKSAKAAAAVPPAWELRTAEDWLALDFRQKVEMALASGLTPPRRARGEEALDELLLPNLDEDVRRDVQIMEAMRQGDMQEVARLTEERSRRGQLRNELRAAVADEDYSRAAELQRQLKILDRGRADVSQDEGSYDRFLDADPWYLDNLEK